MDEKRAKIGVIIRKLNSLQFNQNIAKMIEIIINILQHMQPWHMKIRFFWIRNSFFFNNSHFLGFLFLGILPF